MKSDDMQKKVNDLVTNIEDLTRIVKEYGKTTTAKVSKSITVNLGNFESLKLSVENVLSYAEADAILLEELDVSQVPKTTRVRQYLGRRKVVTVDESQVPVVTKARQQHLDGRKEVSHDE